MIDQLDTYLNVTEFLVDSMVFFFYQCMAIIETNGCPDKQESGADTVGGRSTFLPEGCED